MNWPFTSDGQSIGASASASVLLMNNQDDLLAVQGTLKSLLQHHSSKASIFWRSAFFTVQLSHLYMTKFLLLAAKSILPNALIAYLLF